MWVNRHRLNNSLVVFIHGLFGGRWNTWTELHDILQSECLTDPLIRSYDLYSFQYPSRIRQPAFDPFILQQLENFLNVVNEKYRTIALVAHSQGGILAKLQVLRHLRNGNGHGLKIDLIITLGTPHRGASLWNPVIWPYCIYGIRNILPFGHLRQLTFTSPNIRELRQNWGDHYISATLCPPTANRRYIRSVAVVGAYDLFVGRRSAEGFAAVDQRNYLAIGHRIVKAVAKVAEEVILPELRNHGQTQRLEAEQRIDQILADPAKHSDYLHQNMNLIATKVRRARPELAKNGILVKTAGLLKDFLHDFPQRPLRHVTLPEALETYVDRQLGPEK